MIRGLFDAKIMKKITFSRTFLTRSENLTLNSGNFFVMILSMISADSCSMISWILLLILYAGFCNFFSNGFKRAKKASMDGKPGIVESPGKLIMALSISLSESSSVAGSSYSSLYKLLSYSLISELIGSLS